LAAAALAGTAAADPPPKPPPRPPAPPRLFLSPSGEPFHLSPSDPDPLKAWFDQVDAKHQGYIDRDAFRADAARFFKQLDENGDGVIDGFEVADYEAKVVPEMAEWAEGRYPGQFGSPQGEAAPSGQDPSGQGPSGQGQHRHGQPPQHDGAAASAPPSEGGHGRGRPSRGIVQLINEPEPVSGADFNLDSHITLAEWMRATDDRFELLDAGHSGRLTLDALRVRINGPLPAPRK
jgi:hypothetical protein